MQPVPFPVDQSKALDGIIFQARRRTYQIGASGGVTHVLLYCRRQAVQVEPLEFCAVCLRQRCAALKKKDLGTRPKEIAESPCQPTESRPHPVSACSPDDVLSLRLGCSNYPLDLRRSFDDAGCIVTRNFASVLRKRCMERHV